MRFWVIVFLCIGCATSPDLVTPKLLIEDKNNKILELQYLHEIEVAEEHNDSEALDFFLKEYLSVPRLEIPEDLKTHPHYFEGGKHIKY